MGTGYRLASIADTALDLDAMGQGLKEYMSKRDEALVQQKAGELVTWFHCADIPTSVYQRFVMSGVSESDQNRRAFQSGVQGVAHLVDREGVLHAGRLEPTGKFQASSGEWRVWTEPEMEMFAPIFVEEIGSYIRQRSALPFGCDFYYRPPPLCLHVFVARASLLAGALQETQALSNAEAKEQPTPELASDGDAPTAAPATASPIEP